MRVCIARRAVPIEIQDKCTQTSHTLIRGDYIPYVPPTSAGNICSAVPQLLSKYHQNESQTAQQGNTHVLTLEALEGDLISFVSGNSERQHFAMNYAVELICGGKRAKFLINFPELRGVAHFRLMRIITAGCTEQRKLSGVSGCVQDLSVLLKVRFWANKSSNH